MGWEGVRRRGRGAHVCVEGGVCLVGARESERESARERERERDVYHVRCVCGEVCFAGEQACMEMCEGMHDVCDVQQTCMACVRAYVDAWR